MNGKENVLVLVGTAVALAVVYEPYETRVGVNVYGDPLSPAVDLASVLVPGVVLIRCSGRS